LEAGLRVLPAWAQPLLDQPALLLGLMAQLHYKGFTKLRCYFASKLEHLQQGGGGEQALAWRHLLRGVAAAFGADQLQFAEMRHAVLALGPEAGMSPLAMTTQHKVRACVRAVCDVRALREVACHETLHYRTPSASCTA
jgi:hypothetical protein